MAQHARLFDPSSEMKAVISEDGQYRYELSRTWKRGPGHLVWIMLNPSTADGIKDDPTIRRCINFTKAWGMGGLVVVNLFALRTTDPSLLARHPDPVGPENDEYASFWINQLPAIAAWGSHPIARQRARWVAEQAWFSGHPVRCLGITKQGAPRHPLFVRGDTVPAEYEVRVGE